MDLDQDRPQARTASGPRVMASPRNLASTVLRLAGHATTAAATPAARTPLANDHELLTDVTGP